MRTKRLSPWAAWSLGRSIRTVTAYTDRVSEAGLKHSLLQGGPALRRYNDLGFRVIRDA